MSSFQNKTVVITGAAGGLGTALCHAFGEQGATIAGIDIRDRALRQLQGKLEQTNIQAACLKADITNPSQCREAMDNIAGLYGGIDVLICNAALTHIQRFQPKYQSVVRRLMEVNFFGSVNCTSAALSHLQQSKGTIIVISSVAGFAPLIGRTAYAASKHALHGFFETLRCEQEEKGIHVMMVCPSFIETDFRKNAGNLLGYDTKVDNVETGQPSMPDEVAAEIVQGAEKKVKLLVTGKTGKWAWRVHRINPSLYEKMMMRKMKKLI